MGKLATKSKFKLSLAAIRGAIAECAFKPNAVPMRTFIEISTDKTYLINRAKEELEMFLTSGNRSSLIFATRLLIICLALSWEAKGVARKQTDN